jgi:photosystem II stability/assembly factor-like uncharacterized protein
MIRIAILLLSLFGLNVKAQTNEQRIKSFENSRKSSHPINSIEFRNVGPTVMSGRVVALSVNPINPNEFYVAFASGGLFHTINNGQSMESVFEKEATITIGALAVDWKNNKVWIGTGEVNSSRSSYAGLGIYTSNDSCKTWQHAGLTEAQHIGSIVLSPTDSNTIYVASLGALYTKGGMPGIYKTVDGGKNWKILPIKNTAGAVQLIMDNKNEKILYACMWDRQRSAWQFDGSGNQSAIYKSIDAGNTWDCITNSSSGFPNNNGVGRIGMAVSPSNSKILYALLDNQNRQESNKSKKSSLKALTIKDMSDAEFLNLPDKQLNDYLKENDYDKSYNATNIKQSIRDKKFNVSDVANWVLSDGGAALFQTPIIGAELYKSTDGGTTWKKTHSKNIEGLYFTYGYYFGNVMVSPMNSDEVYICGYTLLKSKDGGETFKEIAGDNVHADHHALWINPLQPKHLINGNDGGINITYDDGKNWFKANNPAVGQCYAIAVDNAEPYNVYCGLQDNGTWMGPSDYKSNNSWHQTGRYQYKELGGGDGMQIQIDTRDNTTAYTGYQFGYYQRNNTKLDDEAFSIHPTFKIGETALRYNWQTPILLSKHNQDILYMGSNKFHRSLNKGANIKTMQQDLAPTALKGNVPYGTISSIAESPLQFGYLFCGTDNGLVYSSTDVGVNFKELSLPKNIAEKKLWVSRIVASSFQVDKLYIALNGYRQDDFSPYLLVSKDAGKTFLNITNGLPNEPINVIKEDPKHGNILYVGTDNGLYISYDTGANWIPWQSNLPRVAIHDIAIQEKANEIVLGTHGRSIYIGSLNQVSLVDSIKQVAFLMLSKMDSVKFSEKWGSAWASYADENEPLIKALFYSKEKKKVTVQVLSGKTILFQQDLAINAGIQNFEYHAHANIVKDKSKLLVGDNNKTYLQKGSYQLKIMEGSSVLGTSKIYIY